MPRYGASTFSGSGIDELQIFDGMACDYPLPWWQWVWFVEKSHTESTLNCGINCQFFVVSLRMN